ncbi:MAG: transcriptional regulator, AraC family [Enterobacter mori]|nr:transcriptional regulator, AraC family [Enterobacter mori]
MACASEQEKYQQWLAQINQVCGRFDARPLEGTFIGELETSYARSLKLSTVTSISWQDKSRQISLLVPRQIIEQQCRFQEVSCALTLSRSLPTVQLSHRLLQESMGNAALSDRESEAALEAMVCLLRPAFQQRDVVQPRKERQFQHVLSLIDDHIQSDALRPEWIATESGMSVRSLYRMFADKGLVVAQYIKNRRLDLCAQVLRSASDDEKLAGIGYSWGFADHSHFSTAFKQRFGVSPGEYRKRFR